MNKAMEAGARAIFEFREVRNFPPDGRHRWEDAPASVRTYYEEMAKVCVEAWADTWLKGTLT